MPFESNMVAPSDPSLKNYFKYTVALYSSNHGHIFSQSQTMFISQIQ